MIDKKLCLIACNLFMKMFDNGSVVHYHRGYTLQVTCNNVRVAVKVQKRVHQGKKYFDTDIYYSVDECYSHARGFNQHCTNFSSSTLNTIYRCLYVMYHNKVNNKDLSADVYEQLIKPTVDNSLYRGTI